MNKMSDEIDANENNLIQFEEPQVLLNDQETETSHCFRRSRSRSRSRSVETCIRRTESIDMNSQTSAFDGEGEGEEEEPVEQDTSEEIVKYKAVEIQEENLSLIAKFSKGALGGIFSCTPLCAVIGFEVKEALGSRNGLLGALLSAATSALLGGIISSIALSFYQTNIIVNEVTNEPIKTDEASDQTNTSKKTSTKTELTEDDIEFITTHTDFNRQTVLRWFASFKNQCPDCLLDKQSFITFYKNLIPGNCEVKEEFAEAVFQAFDSDNNGFVDFGEFLIAFWMKAKGSVRNKLLWLFQVYDNDKSGYISMTELTHMLRLVFCLKSMSDDPVERAQYVMKLVDKNSDGQLSMSEFIDGCMLDEELRNLLET